jgi:hypothetical protein
VAHAQPNQRPITDLVCGRVDSHADSAVLDGLDVRRCSTVMAGAKDARQWKLGMTSVAKRRIESPQVASTK